MKQKKTGKQSMIGTIITMLIVALAILAVYYYMINTDRTKQKEQTEKSEVQLLLDRDIDTNYPATPREVVKLYLRIMASLYETDIKEEQLQGLAKQMRVLLDDELLERNPWESYLTDLKAEVEKFHQEEREMDRYEVEKGSAVNYYTKQGEEYASLRAEITMRDQQLRYRTGEEFILRKDTEGNYKILGWQMTEDTNLDEH